VPKPDIDLTLPIDAGPPSPSDDPILLVGIDLPPSRLKSRSRTSNKASSRLSYGIDDVLTDSLRKPKSKLSAVSRANGEHEQEQDTPLVEEDDYFVSHVDDSPTRHRSRSDSEERFIGFDFGAFDAPAFEAADMDVDAVLPVRRAGTRAKSGKGLFASDSTSKDVGDEIFGSGNDLPQANNDWDSSDEEDSTEQQHEEMFVPTKGLSDSESTPPSRVLSSPGLSLASSQLHTWQAGAGSDDRGESPFEQQSSLEEVESQLELAVHGVEEDQEPGSQEGEDQLVSEDDGSDNEEQELEVRAMSIDPSPPGSPTLPSRVLKR
jgi:hypothetical protein